MITTWYDLIQIGERTRTPVRTITEADIVQFALLSGDNFPLHVDAEYARTTAFGERIAHGMLVLSIATGLITLQPPFVLAFYGIDRLRFVAPTRIGDTIAAETEVIAKQERSTTAGVVTNQLWVKNQRGEDVIVGTIKMLVARDEAR